MTEISSNDNYDTAIPINCNIIEISICARAKATTGKVITWAGRSENDRTAVLQQSYLPGSYRSRPTNA